jgi:F0F1-type ATP synthase epsilon subunit
VELFIISPREEQHHVIAWLDVTTANGNFVIRHGHAPMIMMLLPNHSFIFALENGVQKSMYVRQAVVQVDRTRTTIVMNESE